MRPPFEHLRHGTRAWVKEAVWYLLTSHVPGAKNDICLFATRRGGSTWLMELIGANKRIRFIDQPTSIQTRTLTASQARHIPKFDLGVIVHLEPDQEARLRDFLDRIFEGALPINAPTRFWRRDFDFRSDRLVLKLVDANGIIDWVDSNYDVDVVYLTRHPIPQALSCMRNNWTLTTGAYLRSEWFVQNHLGDHRLEYCRELLETASLFEKFVLNWAFENMIPLSLLPQRPHWTHLTYEDCILNPEQTIIRLTDALALDDVDSMLERVHRASRSSGASTRDTQSAILAGDTTKLIGGWRSEVSTADERRAFEILERLGIGLYAPGADVAV